MAQRVSDEEKIRQWNNVIDQMANYRPPNPPDPIPPSPRGPQSIPLAAFVIEGDRLYKHPNGYSIEREDNWLVDSEKPEKIPPSTMLQ
jgi:hypothetical protein